MLLMHRLRLKDNLLGKLSFHLHCVGPRAQTQVARLGNRYISSLSHPMTATEVVYLFYCETVFPCIAQTVVKLLHLL